LPRKSKKLRRDEKMREKKPVPLIQLLYDDIFLMLLLGLIVPALTYTIWGLIEIISKKVLP